MVQNNVYLPYIFIPFSYTTSASLTKCPRHWKPAPLSSTELSHHWSIRCLIRTYSLHLICSCFWWFLTTMAAPFHCISNNSDWKTHNDWSLAPASFLILSSVSVHSHPPSPQPSSVFLFLAHLGSPCVLCRCLPYSHTHLVLWAVECLLHVSLISHLDWASVGGDLLFSFTFYLFPYLLFPLKMKLKSPVPADTHTYTVPNKTQTSCAIAYERAHTSRPTFALPSSHPFASHLTLFLRHRLCFLCSHCKYEKRQMGVLFLRCVVLFHF